MMDLKKKLFLVFGVIMRISCILSWFEKRVLFTNLNKMYFMDFCNDLKYIEFGFSDSGNSLLHILRDGETPLKILISNSLLNLCLPITPE